MKKLSILLLFISTTHAEMPQACRLVDDTSETIMQLQQSGLSLEDAEIQTQALTPREAQLLKAMLDEAKNSPIFKIDLTRQKAIDDFRTKWLKACLESDQQISNELPRKT